MIHRPNSTAQITGYRGPCYISQFPTTAELRNNIVLGLAFGTESSIVIIGKAGLRAVPGPAGPLRRSHPNAFDNYANVICASGFENGGIH